MNAPRPYVIGLTGSIGMGKTETAKLFAAEGVPVFDADAAIHDLYAGEAAALIEREFPGATKKGVVDRAALSAKVTNDPAALARLEAIMHPLVQAAQDRFLAGNAGAPVVLLDIPLLLETGVKVDAVVVASAPAHIQRQRVLSRPGMSEEKFAALLARQMSDAEKRAQAHYVVTTDRGLDHAREQVKMILADIRQKTCAR
ncbi:MAG: dephospho-CoA kinase [Alphaproteobacteria bacterium]|nr:dephospho-CoA kinase [Alphaproteobacteria bacterium]